jgi:predicted metalloprotease with PDZ domain
MQEGQVSDVVPGLPADAAGIGVGATIVAVNSRAYTPTVLNDALKRANARDGKLELLMRNADFFSTHRIDYRNGPRHPHLVRDEAKQDWLTQILTPRTWTPEAKQGPKAD